MKKLSIITICYNEPNLEKTCESIVNQSWQDFEWIVVDGGSNEETLAVFENITQCQHFRHVLLRFLRQR